MTDIQLATTADIPYMVGLHKRLTEQLGFIPASGYETEVGRGNIFVARENNDPVGFIYAGKRGHTLTVHQCAVQDDARRLQIGASLVDAAVAASNARYGLCRVRDGLEAHEFWKGIGWQPVNRAPGGKQRGRELIVYAHPFAPVLFSCGVPEQRQGTGGRIA